MRKLTIIVLLQFVMVYAFGAGKPSVAYRDANVRFTVITDGTVRMEYAPDGRFVDNKSFLAVNRTYPSVQYKLTDSKKWVTIETDKFILKYKKGTGAFTKDNLSVRSAKKFFTFNWTPGVKQKANLKGTHRTLDGMDGGQQIQGYVVDSQVKHELELEDGILSKDGWTFIDDSKNFLFDNDQKWEWVKEREVNGGQDWYFMAYGHDYKKALKDFTVFAGKVPMPPKYAFGYWWSRYWSYSDKELRELVDNFHSYGIPLDVLVVDMDWHYTEQGKGGWTGWTWNKRLFPSPEGFLKYVKDNDLRVTLNLHPADGVAEYENHYAEVAKDMQMDPASKQTVPWTVSDKRFVTSVFERILDPMQRQGVDFWWLDWQQHMYDRKMKNLSNTWWINYVFFSRMQHTTPNRPMLYHRWGGLGNHRYQIGFSGDAVASWKSLDYQPYFNSTASNVLYGYWSHDLGGHIGNHIDPELYVRWMQFGAFSPIMRTHSQKNAGMNKEPWVFNHRTFEILKSTIRMRYEFVPYIYTMVRKAYDEGISLCRPMYYDYPEEDNAYQFRNQYMFGDDVMIAPVTAAGKDGLATMQVWLPKGEWYELSSGTLLQGGQVLKRSFELDEYPIYIKVGSILPMYGDNVPNLAHEHPLTVTVFPGKADATFSLYEDNGVDNQYAGQYATTRLQSSWNQGVQRITIGRRQGQYAGMSSSRQMTLRLVAAQAPTKVTLNGKPLTWRYDGTTFSVVAELPTLSNDEEAAIEITYPATSCDLNGLIGSTRRLGRAIEQLKYRDAGIVLKDGLGTMGSLNEALMYAPDQLAELVETYRRNYQNLPEVLKEQGLSDENTRWLLNTLHWETK